MPVDFDARVNRAVIQHLGDQATVTLEGGATFTIAGDFHAGGHHEDLEGEVRFQTQITEMHVRASDIPAGMSIDQGARIRIRDVDFIVADRTEDDSGLITLELDEDL